MTPASRHLLLEYLDRFKALALPMMVMVCAVAWGCSKSTEFLRFTVWLVLLAFTTLGCFFSWAAAEKHQNSIFNGVLFLSLLAILVSLLIKGIPFIFDGENLGLF